VKKGEPGVLNRRFKFSTLVLIGLFIFASVMLRLTLTETVVTPDSRFFAKIADNLTTNGCYSISNVSLAECEPTWGSQPPGYPVFMALVSYLPGSIFNLTVVVQTLLFSLACVYALWASYCWHKKKLPLIVSALGLSLSPASVGWSQWVLTETMAAAAALWLFAEIFRSLSEKKLRTKHIGFALLTATLFRWDMILLSIPVLVTALYLEGTRQGIIKILGSCAPTVFVITVLMVRAALVGLPLVPSTLSDTSIPQGLVAFWRGGARTQAATSGFLWPVWSRRYGKIEEKLDYHAFHRSFNSQAFSDLLKRIDRLPPGTPLPPDIDIQLDRLASKARQSVNYSYAGLLADRTASMWFGEDLIAYSGWRSVFGSKSVKLAADMSARAHRVFLLLLALGLILFLRKESALMVLSVLLLYLFRTLFLSSLTALEIRYLAPVIPVMELVLFSLMTIMLIEKYEASLLIKPKMSDN
jgi:hypothetical protein